MPLTHRIRKPERGQQSVIRKEKDVCAVRRRSLGAFVPRSSPGASTYMRQYDSCLQISSRNQPVITCEVTDQYSNSVHHIVHYSARVHRGSQLYVCSGGFFDDNSSTESPDYHHFSWNPFLVHRPLEATRAPTSHRGTTGALKTGARSPNSPEAYRPVNLRWLPTCLVL